MLYIHILSSVHNPEKLYLVEELNSSDGSDEQHIKTYSPSEVAHDYVYDETGHFDAYNLIVWGCSARCTEHVDYVTNFKVDTNESIFDLTHHIDFDLGFERTSELFTDWSASRRNKDYYLTINIYSVSKELADQYVECIEKCIADNFRSYEHICDFPQISTLFESSDESYNYSTSSDAIEKFERYPGSKCFDISWDIDFPQYEGSGIEADLLLSIATIAIPIVVEVFGITDAEKQHIRTYYRHMKKIREKICCTKDFHGELKMPAYRDHAYDRYGNTVYRVLVVDKYSGLATQQYIAKVKKMGLWREKYSIRLDPTYDSDNSHILHN